MADADVNVRMTAQTANAQSAWLSVIAALNNVEASLKRIEKTSARSGRSARQEFTSMRNSAGAFAKSVAAVVGVGGPLASMLTLVQTIRKEVDAVIQAGEQSADFGVRREQLLARATTALGVGRETSTGSFYTSADLERDVQRLSSERRISQLALLQALEGGFAAGGELAADEIIETVSRTGEVFPQLALPESGEDLTQVSGAILEIQKAERLAGRNISSDQAIGAFIKLFNQSRATTIQEFSGPFVSALSQAAVLTGGKDTLGDVGALMATVQQAAVDPSGRRSATNLITAMERFQEAIVNELPEMTDMGMIERMDFLAKAETPEAVRARRRLLGVFSPDVTDAEAALVEYGTGTSLGEKRTEAILRALITEGSRVRELFGLIRGRVGDPTSQESVDEAFQTLERMQRSTAILQARRDRNVVTEQALVSTERLALMAEFGESAEEAMKAAQMGDVPFASMRSGFRGMVRGLDTMRGLSEVESATFEIHRMRAVAADLEARAESEKDEVDKQEILGRAEALRASIAIMENRLAEFTAASEESVGGSAPMETALLRLVRSELSPAQRLRMQDALGGVEEGERLVATREFLERERMEAVEAQRRGGAPESSTVITGAIERLDVASQTLAEGLNAFSESGAAMRVINDNTRALDRVADAMESSDPGPRGAEESPAPAPPPLRPQK